MLDALGRLERRHGQTDFRLEDIVAETMAGDPQFKESTIRTHVTSRMCREAPEHHGTTYEDLTRVSRGVYRRR